MKRHLNTLFVTTQGAYLSKEGRAVLVKVEKETKLRVPLHTLGGIVCFGQISCSPFLMGMCAEAGVAMEKTTVGLLLHLQARLLARYFRSDLDGYPPFIWR